jgi:two-component system, NtrC family, response regulator HydG
VAPSVLVVDDDVGMVDTLVDILSARRYRVGTAYSGEAAVAMVRQMAYDAVLMDIQMPGLNGVEALRQIKGLAPKLSVIMMTAFTRDELVEEARQATAVTVLPKPLDMDSVLTLLVRVIGSTAPGAPGGA